jgi:hypothetical protein
MTKLLGATMKPYDAVYLPINQHGRSKLSLACVALDIFRLRNAFAHGKPIPDSNWLGVSGANYEDGYAYQLLEQTEILLRLSLIKILENKGLFETFADAKKLDAYF